MIDRGALAARRLAEIARISEPGPGVTRLPFTKEHRAALELLTRWFTEAGLTVHLDAAGTLVGRLEGPHGAASFLLGSHQDSVREGGAFDGMMGVVLSVLALQKLREDGVNLPFAVEILAFPDEEGVRFPTTLIGPRALAGTFDPAVLEMSDSQGVPLRSALAAFGQNPDDIPGLRRSDRDVIGYLETHIEQGLVLEQAGEAVGVVTAICGIERYQITLTGESGHAGTLPMASRRDALVGAAAIVSEVNRMARERAALRGTVGALSVAPNVVNAVPREARLTVELRSPDDAVREKAGRELTAFAGRVAAQHHLSCETLCSYHQPAQPCHPELSDRLAEAVQAAGGAGLRLPSGATHDASAMADLCPIAMLFVRCSGGLSHVPAEHADPGDLAVAIEVLSRFLESMRSEYD